jgi:poly(hydroxyalkanoate) depolymerase family esterase
MNMNDILEITRLVRAGGIKEATARIRQALKGIPPPATATGANDTTTNSSIIEGDFHVIDDASILSIETPTVGQSTPRRPSARFQAPLAADWRESFRRLHRAPAAPDLEPGVDSTGQFLTRSYTNHAGTRAYKLYIPSGYRGQAVPLIVMLHGCTQDPDDFAAGTRMNRLAEEHHCFVVYPAQAPDANPSKCWNWFRSADQRRGEGEPSIIAGITRHVIDNHPVDKRRVYVAGLSAGGAMAAIMGMTYPDLYAAIGIHSGLPYAVADDLPSAFAAMQGRAVQGQTNVVAGTETCRQVVPAIVFHGDLDINVHPQNGDLLIAQWTTIITRNGMHGEAAEKPRETVHRGQVPDGHAYSRTTHRDANGRIVLEHWLVHGAGHAWSGGSPNGSYTDSLGPDAGREMIRFFLEHPHLEMAGQVID